MFAPTKTWRKWHRKIPKGQRRFATCSALAATSVPSLVLARGHRIESIAEIPFVIRNDDIDNIAKTNEAVKFLKKIEAFSEIEKVQESRKLRKGKGKARNRRHVKRKGPLIVYLKEDSTVQQAFRNIPGIEFCHVTRLNLLQLAPGGHMGRFIIWTEDAFRCLDDIFGTFTQESAQKKGWSLPASKMTNCDLARIINSDEIQSAIRPKQFQKKFSTRKKNPLRNLGAMVKLNPYALTQRRRIILASEKSAQKRRAKVQRKRVGKRYLEEILFAPMAILVDEGPHREEVDEGFYVGEDVSVSSEEEEVVEAVKTEGEDDKDGDGDDKGKDKEPDTKKKGKS
jgi:large subunit ribosomal protein L4e